MYRLLANTIAGIAIIRTGQELLDLFGIYVEWVVAGAIRDISLLGPTSF